MGNPLKLLMPTSSGTGTGTGGGGSGASGDVIPATYFGLHINNFAPTSIWADYDSSAQNHPAGNYRPTPFPTALSPAAMRLWDGNGCYWRNIERTKGVFSWGRLDHYVDQMRAAGVTEIQYCLGHGPDWATAPDYGQATVEFGLSPGNHVGFNPHSPNSMTDWADWCAAVATRYAGRITHYEPWNEVNDAASWVGYRGTLADLIEMATIMRDVIAPLDPAAKFMTPNFTGSGLISTGADSLTLASYLAAGGGDVADIVAVHAYSGLTPYPQPESVLTHGRQVRDICRQNGVDLPIWNNEWAATDYVDDSSVVVTAPPMEPVRAAGQLVRMLLCTWLAGYRRYCHYTLDWIDSTIRMVDPASPGTLLPPATAWAYAQALLADGKLSGLTNPVDPVSGYPYYIARFAAADGRKGRIYWMIDYPRAVGAGLPRAVTIPMPADAVEIADVLGSDVAIGATLTITGQPQYLFTEV